MAAAAAIARGITGTAAGISFLRCCFWQGRHTTTTGMVDTAATAAADTTTLPIDDNFFFAIVAATVGHQVLVTTNTGWCGTHAVSIPCIVVRWVATTTTC